MPDTSEDVKKQPYKETYFGRSIEDWPESPNPTQKFAQYLFALFDKPITFIRGKIRHEDLYRFLKHVHLA